MSSSIDGMMVFFYYLIIDNAEMGMRALIPISALSIICEQSELKKIFKNNITM